MITCTCRHPGWYTSSVLSHINPYKLQQPVPPSYLSGMRFVKALKEELGAEKSSVGAEKSSFKEDKQNIMSNEQYFPREHPQEDCHKKQLS